MKRDQSPPRDNPLFVQVLEKGIEVLRSFTAQRRTMTLGEIAEITELSKSSVQRIVYTLESLGYVMKHPQTRRFQLTTRVMDIGYNYLAADTLVDVANPFLAELSNSTGETVNLMEPSGHDMVYVARFASHRFIPMHMPIGCRIPMFCTASGRAYLWALPEPECDALLDTIPMQAYTPNTVTDKPTLKALLHEGRRLGYSLNTEELYAGDMAIAVPIMGGQGQPIAALNVITPPSRWTLETVRQQIASKIMECARSVSNAVRAFG
ncbi:IclR family transcriptional regulator [Bordetella muralis]|uniref:IclR family transcriptional regulator n=1 Tax=Bordetella muralis TaxID=1649130 RepID=UPI0039F071A0